MRGEISPRLAILKRATRQSVEALGGLELAAGETSVGRAQLSRCQSSNDRDMLSLRDALTLDELTTGNGGPYHLRALARLLNHAVVPLPDVVGDPADLAGSIALLAAELGDVSRAVVTMLADGPANDDRQGAVVLDELDQLIHLAAALRHTTKDMVAAARKLRKRGATGRRG